VTKTRSNSGTGQRLEAVARSMSLPPTPRQLMQELLDPTRGVLIVDRARRICSVNRAFEEALGSPRGLHIGKCLGDALLCGHAVHSGNGCGESAECEHCAARSITLDALNRDETHRSLARFRLLAGGTPREVTLPLCAAPLELNGEPLAVLIVEDLGPLRHLDRIDTAQSFHGMVGQDPQMLYLFDTVRHVGPIDVSVLIEGESGTGKQMVARALHRESPRRDRPLINVNACALVGELAESELFGHVKGAFTGAVRNKRGRFQLAHRGTILLDEVGELSTEMQVKLLRVLQDGTFEPVGSEVTLHVDSRVLCATNRTLQTEVDAGRFRLDLFYRLCVVQISLPPLRERIGDIPLLAEHLLARAAKDFGRPPPKLMPSALSALNVYPWPGNVRELDNAMRFALIHSRGEPVGSEDLPAAIRRGAPPSRETAWSSRPRNRAEVTAEMIQKAVRVSGGNKSEAARRLGISRATLYRRLAGPERGRGP